MRHVLTGAVLGWMALAGAAQAEAAAVGVWKTEPDKKGQVGHVRIAPCGASLCGTVVRAYDAAGKPVKTANVGRQVISGMSGRSGAYKGKLYVPTLKATLNAKMALRGDRMKVSGCFAGVCASRNWRRVK